MEKYCQTHEDGKTGTQSAIRYSSWHYSTFTPFSIPLLIIFAVLEASSFDFPSLTLHWLSYLFLFPFLFQVQPVVGKGSFARGERYV